MRDNLQSLCLGWYELVFYGKRATPTALAHSSVVTTRVVGALIARVVYRLERHFLCKAVGSCSTLVSWKCL